MVRYSYFAIVSTIVCLLTANVAATDIGDWASCTQSRGIRSVCMPAFGDKLCDDDDIDISCAWVTGGKMLDITTSFCTEDGESFKCPADHVLYAVKDDGNKAKQCRISYRCMPVTSGLDKCDLVEGTKCPSSTFAVGACQGNGCGKHDVGLYCCAISDAATPQPTTAQPTTLAPTTVEPTTGTPVTPATTPQPTTTEVPTTVTPQPTTAEPATSINTPTTAEPATTTAQPTTAEPATTTAQPTTVKPTTQQPTTAEPSTTMQPTTTTEPTTVAPTTVAPTTAEPTTVKPTTTEPTTTAQPTTAQPTTTTPPTTTQPTAQPVTTVEPATTTAQPATTTAQPATTTTAAPAPPTPEPTRVPVAPVTPAPLPSEDPALPEQALEVSVAFAMSVDEALARKDALVAEVAGACGVDAERVSVLSVRAGSIIVVFEVVTRRDKADVVGAMNAAIGDPLHPLRQAFGAVPGSVTAAINPRTKPLNFGLFVAGVVVLAAAVVALVVALLRRRAAYLKDPLEPLPPVRTRVYKGKLVIDGRAINEAANPEYDLLFGDTSRRGMTYLRDGCVVSGDGAVRIVSGEERFNAVLNAEAQRSSQLPGVSGGSNESDGVAHPRAFTRAPARGATSAAAALDGDEEAEGDDDGDVECDENLLVRHPSGYKDLSGIALRPPRLSDTTGYDAGCCGTEDYDQRGLRLRRRRSADADSLSGANGSVIEAQRPGEHLVIRPGDVVVDEV